MKLRSALAVVLGLPFAAGCGLLLGVEEREVTAHPDAPLASEASTTGSDSDGSRVADAAGHEEGGPIDAEASAPSFDPASLASLELWLDGDRGITTSAGEVASWDDQSGHARMLVRGNPASKSIVKAKFPGSTHDALQFAPDSDAGPSAGYLVRTGFTLPQPLTVALAVHPTRIDPGFYDIFFGGTAVPTLGLARYADDFTSSAGSGATFTVLRATNAWTKAPHILVAVFDGAASSLTIDGVKTAGALDDAASLIGLGLSSSSPFHGYLGEVLVYSRNLPAPEQAAVSAYLGARYAP